jgi:AhpD family alkylhydroperoxidase
MLIFFELMAEKSLSTEDVESREDASDEKKWPSYSMVEARMRKVYFRFYKETYKSTDIDRKTKELIAIAASLGFNCAGCLEGHLKKALDYGATKEEISESISIAMGVAAAGVVDQTDIAAEKLQLDHFD